MGTELALTGQINPARLPSLPAPLQRLSDALGSAVQADTDGMHREVAVLPAGMNLNSSERNMIENHVADLGRALGTAQAFEFRGQVLSNDAAIGALITGLLLKGSGAKLDKVSSDALTEDYLDAIEDLPAWSVREALRKWNRRESPAPIDPRKPHDFGWRPGPPLLRWLAQCELAPIQNRVRRLRGLLEAVPLIEFTDEHRQCMVKRLAELPIGAQIQQQHSEAAE